MTKEQKIELYNQAKEAYYNGEPILTDLEFDELEKELGLENKSYIGTRHNPSYTVEHPVTMGSLSKVQVKENSNGEVEWDSLVIKVNGYIKPAQEVITTPKFDGCSFEVVVKNKEIISISSRGDGKFGKDLKNHLIHLVKPNVNGMNEVLENYILRGEVLVEKSVFEKKYSKDFVNTRSFVAGTLGNDYSDDLRGKLNDLKIVIYDIKEIRGSRVIEHDWIEFINNLKDSPEVWKFISWNGTDNELHKIYEFYNEYRKKCPFSLDGIVMKPKAKNRLNNYSDVRPKDCVAIKFIPMLQETVVKEIKWNLGKTGELIPIILVEPVEMDGKMIGKCSGHNYGYLLEKEVSVGTKVILSLAGDIIPFLYKVTDTSDFSEDKLCIPSDYLTKVDGCHLMAILDEKEITKQQFLNSVTALNIPSIGPAGAKAIFDYLGTGNGEETDEFFGESTERELPNNILLVSPEDIWMGLGCGKTGENGKKAFSKIIKNITLVDIIKSCNFRLCGGKAAIQIEKYLTDQDYDFTHLPEVAISWAKDKNSENFKLLQKIVEYLGRSFEDFKKIAVETASKDEDKIPVILTGEPTQYGTKANFLKAHPEYRMTGSWKEVKIVFTNSLESNTGKMKKAREKNIEIRLY